MNEYSHLLVPFTNDDGSFYHIRLISFVVDEDNVSDANSPIRLSLEVALLKATARSESAGQSYDVNDIQSRTSYVCLSYVWGTPVFEHMIFVDGREFFVAENLHDFLLTARQKLQTGTWKQSEFPAFWIDQLCINQDDNEEKNQQVARMGEIYAGAKTVVAWLGKIESSLETFLDVVVEECSDNPLLPVGDGSGDEDYNFGRVLKHYASIMLQSAQVDEETCGTLAFNAIQTFVKNPYWSRLWIRQEFLLSQKLLFCGGRSICDRSTLQYVWLAAVGHPYIFGDRDIDHLPFLDFHRWLTASSAVPQGRFRGNHALAFTLDHQMDQLDHLRCSDPRDRIYSLLAPMEDMRDFHVDYNEPVEDLYFRFMDHQYNLRDPSIANQISITLINGDFQANRDKDFLWFALYTGYKLGVSPSTFPPREGDPVNDSMKSLQEIIDLLIERYGVVSLRGRTMDNYKIADVIDFHESPGAYKKLDKSRAQVASFLREGRSTFSTTFGKTIKRTHRYWTLKDDEREAWYHTQGRQFRKPLSE